MSAALGRHRARARRSAHGRPHGYRWVRVPDSSAYSRSSTFHLKIVEIARNRFLLKTVSVLQGMMHASMCTTLSLPGRLNASRADHRDIVEAVATNDPRQTSTAMHDHLESARMAALSRLEDKRRTVASKTPGPVTAPRRR